MHAVTIINSELHTSRMGQTPHLGNFIPEENRWYQRMPLRRTSKLFCIFLMKVGSPHPNQNSNSVGNLARKLKKQLIVFQRIWLERKRWKVPVVLQKLWIKKMSNITVISWCIKLSTNQIELMRICIFSNDVIYQKTKYGNKRTSRKNHTEKTEIKIPPSRKLPSWGDALKVKIPSPQKLPSWGGGAENNRYRRQLQYDGKGFDI